MRRERWREGVVVVVVLAAGAGVYMYAHRAEDRLEESKRRGSAIVRALADYHAEQGTYPERLDALVPAYLPSIAQPTWGHAQWSYRRYTPADVGAADGAADVAWFQLSVAADASGYPVLYYDHDGGRWVLNN